MRSELTFFQFMTLSNLSQYEVASLRIIKFQIKVEAERKFHLKVMFK